MMALEIATLSLKWVFFEKKRMRFHVSHYKMAMSHELKDLYEVQVKKYNISKASTFNFVTFSTEITWLRKSILDATSRSFLNFRQITSCPNDDGGFLHQPEKLRLQTKLPLYGHKKTKRKISEYHRSVCASQIFAVKMRRINGQQQHKFANFTFFLPKGPC